MSWTHSVYSGKFCSTMPKRGLTYPWRWHGWNGQSAGFSNVDWRLVILQFPMSRYPAMHAWNFTMLSTFPRIAFYPVMPCLAVFVLTECNSAAEVYVSHET